MSNNRSVTLSTRPLTVEENQIINNMVDDNEKTSGVFKPTGVSSSTVSLCVKPPASEQKQNQRQYNPTIESVKRDVFDVTEIIHQEQNAR